MGFINSNREGKFSWSENVIRDSSDKIRVYNNTSILGSGKCIILNNNYYEKLISYEIEQVVFKINNLLFNDNWPNELRVYKDSDLISEVDLRFIAKTPVDIMDTLVEFLFKKQKSFGEKINLNPLYENEDLLNSFQIRNKTELNFYLKALKERGHIESDTSDAYKIGTYISRANLSISGLDYYYKISNEGQKSKRCFIAMSFDDVMEETKIIIKSACRKTGYEPILINEVHYDADKTINDAIIAELKKSKFCIADFTGQKDGVYFEAGFALGRGLKVIYSVHEDDLKNSHFDTKHFPHILYKTPQELEEKLINKIEAWIKD